MTRKRLKASLLDAELMAQLADDSMEALNELYHRHVTMVERALIRFADQDMPSADIDELVQEVFLALIKSAQFFGPGRRFKPWLYGIAVQKARNYRRDKWFHYRVLRQHHGKIFAMAKKKDMSPARAAEVRQDVHRVFASLPSKQLEVLLLHAVEGFSGEEIAQALGIRVGTVWSRLHRAREILRQEFPAGIDIGKPAMRGIS